MKITINNDNTTIVNADDHTISLLQERLSFTDKSKQYQIKRLSKSIWGRTSKQYEKLKSEVDQCLLTTIPQGVMIPSSLVGSLHDILAHGEINDLRKETGSKIALPWKNKPSDLRPYQTEAVHNIVNNWRGLLNFATGLGKTFTAIYAIRSIGRKTLVVCPNKSIAEQFYTIMCDAFGKDRVGFYGDGRHHIKDLTVGIAPSVCNHLEEFKKADLGCIVFDETHHIAADTFYAIASALGSTGRIYGLTATDYRSDGKDLLITAGCGHTIVRLDAKWGIENGFLAEPYFIIREVPTTGKDFIDDKLKNYKAHVLNDKMMKSQIEDDARKFMAAGKRVLILVDEVAHGQELATNLNISFATGEDKKSQDYIDAFNKKQVMGLIGTDGKIGEGVDTRPVDVLIMANFVAAKGSVLQAVGRGLRKTDDKKICIILDYIPLGSKMLTRHAKKRVEYYQELTDKVKTICSSQK